MPGHGVGAKPRPTPYLTELSALLQEEPDDTHLHQLLQWCIKYFGQQQRIFTEFDQVKSQMRDLSAAVQTIQRDMSPHLAQARDDLEDTKPVLEHYRASPHLAQARDDLEDTKPVLEHYRAGGGSKKRKSKKRKSKKRKTKRKSR